MEGQNVSIGSSISATGNMLVSCNRPYVLKVNDVVWSPVEVLADADRYILTSGGLIEIMVDDERIFFFRNSVTPDFSFGRNEVRFKAGGIDGTDRGNFINQGTYHQRRFPASDVDYVQVAVYPDEGTASVSELNLVVNQGDVVAGAQSDVYKQYRISNVDPTQYLSVHLGNVLLDFILPFEE